jgi:hypothetical protein
MAGYEAANELHQQSGGVARTTGGGTTSDVGSANAVVAHHRPLRAPHVFMSTAMPDPRASVVTDGTVMEAKMAKDVVATDPTVNLSTAVAALQPSATEARATAVSAMLTAAGFENVLSTGKGFGASVGTASIASRRPMFVNPNDDDVMQLLSSASKMQAMLAGVDPHGQVRRLGLG